MEQITREQIIGLLKVAECPASCDNGVVVRDLLHDEIEQCQFCFERLKAIAVLQAAEPIGWITEDYVTDKSATTYNSEVVDRWRTKGWPVEEIFKLPCPPTKAKVPEGHVATGKSNLVTRREYGETAFEATEKMEQAGFYTAPHARGLLNVPVAAYDPDECTPAMEAAAEKYWKERRFKGLSEDARTWKGLYKAMCAARKQIPAPDELSDYDRGFRDGKLDPLIDEVVAESELAEALGSLIKGYVKLLEAGMDRITSLGGDCDPVFVMDKNDPWLRDARTALSAYRKRNER